MLTETSPNKRARPHDGDAALQNGIQGETQANKRRAFLQTMGQQIRAIGADDSSPRDATPGRPHTGSLASGPAATERALLDQGQIQTPESDAVPGENDHLPSGATNSASQYLWDPKEVSPNTSDEGHQFSFDDLLHWSKSYFDNWHPAYPFIHAPSLLDYFRQIAQHGVIKAEPPEAFHLTILRSVFSISLADRRQANTATQSVPASLLFNSFNHAINSIHCALTEESSILALQAVVSVQLFLISMLRFNAAARLDGLAVRMAVQLSLHRCPVRLALFSREDMEIRKRLFWSIYCIDRYTCIRLGTPLAIRDDDIDVCLPSDEQHHERSTELVEYDHRLSVLEYLAKLAQIRGSIIDLRLKPASLKKDPATNENTFGASAKLSKWWNEVDDYLETNDERPVPVSHSHQVTLNVLRYESTIALNRSVLATSEKNEAYHAALQNCISASKSVINTLHDAAKSPSETETSGNTPLFWPSFTWAVWMSTFVILFAANEDQLSYETASRLANRSLEILNHLSRRGTMWPDACAVAIRNLLARLIEHRTPQRPGKGSKVDITPRPSQSDALSADTRTFNNLQGAQSTPARSRQAEQPLQTPASRTNPHINVTRQTIPMAGRDTQPPEAAHRSISYDSAPRLRTSLGGNSFFDFPLQNIPFSDMPGSFLGIAQQLSDNPISNDEITDLFLGSDMPLWMGDDQYEGFGGGV